MRISTVIPLYNGERFIEEAILSAIRQARPTDELIVVDDGSTDSGPEIVQRLTKTYPITLLQKPNGGQSSARNFGIRHATGDLIALLDQDDVWYQHHLKALERPFLQGQNDRLGYVYSELDLIDDRDRYIAQRFLADRLVTHPGEQHPKRSLVACLDRDMYVVPSAALIRKSALEAVEGFDERFVGYEDDDLFCRLFMAGFEAEFVPEPLAKWRMHSSSSSQTARMAKSRLLFLEKHGAMHDTLGNIARDLLVPRFLPGILAQARDVVFHRNEGVAPACRESLLAFLPHIDSRKHRIRLKLAAAMISSPAAIRASRRWLNPLTRRYYNRILA